jgi:hypothetical protein
VCEAALQTFVRFGIKRRAKIAMYVFPLFLSISYFGLYFVIICEYVRFTEWPLPLTS